MKRVILIRYGELHLKGKNRGQFERALIDNIQHSLKNFEHGFSKYSGRYVVWGYEEENEQEIVDALTKVAGIYSISPSAEVDSTLPEISSVSVGVMRDITGSFRVTANRADKTFEMDSMTLAKQIGGDILSANKNVYVDLFKPEHTLYIDVRENKKTYVFNEIIHCVGGMPVGTSGRGLLLLSGGIDSPVAGYRMVKRGMKIDCIHFESFPHTSRAAEEKAMDLARIIEQYNGKTKVYVVSVAEIQDEIHKNCNEEYMITLVRRFMLRIASKIAEIEHDQAIITGESLGQVASQTIESMAVIGEVLKMPLLKPLVAYDKQETVDIAQKIGSYEISIRPYDDCCTVYLPENPIIKPRLERVLREEAKLDVDLLVERAISKMRVRFADED